MLPLAAAALPSAHLLEGPWVVFDPAFIRRFLAAEAAAAPEDQARTGRWGRGGGESLGASAKTMTELEEQGVPRAQRSICVQRRGTSRFTGVGLVHFIEPRTS